MKTLLKRLVMFAYCRNWISITTAMRWFDRLQLRRH